MKKRRRPAPPPPANGDPLRPWLQRPDESDAAFGAFRCYIEMPGSERGILEVARKYPRNRHLIGRWRKRHGWDARLAAHDAALEADWRAELVKKKLAADKRHLETGEALEGLGRKMLGVIAARIDAKTQKDLAPSDAAKVAKTGIDIQRAILPGGDLAKLASAVESFGKLIGGD